MPLAQPTEGSEEDGWTLPPSPVGGTVLCRAISMVKSHICTKKKGHKGKHKCGIGKCGEKWN